MFHKLSFFIYMFTYVWRFDLTDFTFIHLYSPLGFYYMYLFFQDMEDDFNRLVDFLIHFWVSFQNFINVLQMFLNNLPWRQLI